MIGQDSATAGDSCYIIAVYMTFIRVAVCMTTITRLVYCFSKLNREHFTTK